MPRERDRKGSKTPTKRKAAVPVQDRIELHPISTGKDAASSHASMQIQVSESSDAEVSVSSVTIFLWTRCELCNLLMVF